MLPLRCSLLSAHFDLLCLKCSFLDAPFEVLL
jgi:hypothetical protein